MKTIEVEVTEEHAIDGIPGEADCCAIALAVKETYYPEDHLHVEVNADGSITIKMDGEYEEDTGVTPREELYNLYPDCDQEVEICTFIEDYDGTAHTENYGHLDYFNFPYNFKFFRTTDA